MTHFRDLKNGETISVYIKKSKNVFHLRKAVVERYSVSKSKDSITIVLLNKNGKPIIGNLFSTWFPVREDQFDGTKVCSLYLNVSEVRENPKAVIKEIVTTAKIMY